MGLFVLLLIIPGINGTLQELLSSYDFSYGVPVNISYSDLNISIGLDGNYTYVGEVDGHVFSSDKSVIEIDPHLISNGMKHLGLTLYNNSEIIYDNRDAYTFFFNESIEPEIRLIGIVDDVISIDSSINVSYEVFVVMSGLRSKTINHTFSEGINVIQINLNGNETLRYENIIVNRVEIGEYEFWTNYTISNTPEPDKSYIVGIESESEIDIDNDNLTDSIELEVKLDIKTEDDYLMKCVIYDSYDGYIATLDDMFHLTEGVQVVNFSIDGKRLFASGKDGPYVIRQISIPGDAFDIGYVTDEYYFEYFERGPMADVVLNMTADNESIFIKAKNIGEVPAYDVDIEYYNDITGNFRFPLIKPNETAMFSISLQDDVIAIGDFENKIVELSEENNFAGVQETELRLNDGWNLVSLPYVVLTNLSLITYGERWIESNVLLPTKGYWVRSESNQTLAFRGYFPESNNVIIESGLNMIGPLRECSGIRSIVYNGTWANVEPCLPGRGYVVYG